jgi:iron complex transport system permease protein
MTARADATAVQRARRGAHPARVPLIVSGALLLGAMLLAIVVGPVGIPLGSVLRTVLAHLPLVNYHASTSPTDQAIVWDLRLPRVVLAALVGAMLAAGGASYQGVFRNSLADPYLLGAAAGAGLGATIAIVAGGSGSLILPAAAFAGAVIAVTMTYVVAAAGGGQSAGYAIVVAGIAVTGMFTAVQTYLQQQNVDEIRQIYNWLLGSFSNATWADVRLVLPYLVVSAGILLAHRRILDVLRVGADEAGALGVHPERTRLIIGFVGVIVPHAVRLLAGASYRVVLPVAMLGGAAFMVLADLLARTVQAPSELPISVVTASIGAPFFLLILRSRRTRHGVL